jgi:glycosyltransferase involved in cell wall biosynthesis
MMLVSILIPSYNAARWIGAAVDSALSQSYPHTEVVVVDDGSTDGTLDEIQRFGARVRWERADHGGANAARNRLLELARGEWLQYLDADDYLQPEKLTAQAAHLQSHPDADVIFSPITIDHWSPAGSRLELLPIPEPRDPWILLARWFLPQTGATLWRKQAIVDVGGWAPQQPVCQEHELYLRLLMAGKVFSWCPAPGAVWRIWGDASLSFGRRPEQRRRRLAIESTAEAFLRSSGQLTPARRESIDIARFEIARVAWRQGDRDGAMQAIADLLRANPRFRPDAEPWAYRVLWSSVGFRLAETIAGWRRTARASMGNQ